MELDYYLFKNKMTQCELADKLHMKPQHVNRIVNRRVTPHLSIAIKIHRITKGQVSYEEMLKDDDRIFE